MPRTPSASANELNLPPDGRAAAYRSPAWQVAQLCPVCRENSGNADASPGASADAATASCESAAAAGSERWKNLENDSMGASAIFCHMGVFQRSPCFSNPQNKPFFTLCMSLFA
ncbi:MAG: hypothetical protein J0I91_03015 [Candidatus Accumulibacter sp.]|nr:hypothetical protein [Accumulibacter sp.]